MDNDKALQVIEMIREDIKNDIKKLEGAPFNGRNVAEMFGNQGAAIDALANILEKMLGKDELYSEIDE